MLSASAAGTYLAENFVAPIFEAFNKNSDNTDDDGALAVSLSTDKDSVTKDVTLPGITLYTLQMGIYASHDNACAQADILKAQGAAGYILTDDDKFRVLSAGYEAADDARKVKERLMSDGTDCALFTLSCESSAFKISTDKENADSLINAFAAFKAAQNSLSNAILAFDSNAQSISEGQIECNKILEAFKSDMDIISKSEDIPSQLDGMMNCYDEYCSQLSALSSSDYDNRSTFAAAMKYSQLLMADAYIEFSSELSASL